MSSEPVSTSSLPLRPSAGMIGAAPSPYQQTGMLGYSPPPARPLREPPSPDIYTGRLGYGRPSSDYGWNRDPGRLTTGALPPPAYARPPSWQTSPRLSDPGVPVAGVQGPAGGQVIEVRDGDTLYGLSKRHGVSVAELISVNRLYGGDIEIGQKLLLPAGAHW
jgi:LysM repeat protein